MLVQNEPGRARARDRPVLRARLQHREPHGLGDREPEALSRITIVTTGTPMVIEQIKHQLDRMIPVYRVVDMTMHRPLDRARTRHGEGARRRRAPASRRCGWPEAFRARVIDATTESFVFEITGNTTKINQFIDLMRPLGLVEVSRTGVAAIGRGPEGM